MLNLETVLPEIQRAVDNRSESSTLASMDAEDLRTLIYKIVERQGADPFGRLARAASERHEGMDEARSHSVGIRAGILRNLLRVVRPALPALFGRIVTHTIYRDGSHDSVDHHALIGGVELLNYEKWGPVGEYDVRSGCSWWIVSMRGERFGFADLDGRYARICHYGRRLRDTGAGTADNEIELVTADEAAKEIRDNQIEKIFRELHARLKSMTSKKVEHATDDLWRVANSLDAAMTAMSP